jgi:hypothetical protein
VSRLHEPGAAEAGRNRPERVGQTGEHHRDRAHYEELPANGQRRIDELRQERREEGNRLRIGDGHEEAARYVHATARRRYLSLTPGGPPALDAEPHQIGRADPAQDLEHFGRCLEDPVQAKRDAEEQRGVSERGPDHRDQRRARAARGGSRDHQGDDRTGHDDQDECDEQEGREEVVVHGEHHNGPAHFKRS